MQVRIDDRLQKDLQKIIRKDPKLAALIEKKLRLFADNPKHKSLRIHKLSGKLKSMWSISITKSVRMTYLQSGNEAYFFDIGKHEEVYKK